MDRSLLSEREKGGDHHLTRRCKKNLRGKNGLSLHRANFITLAFFLSCPERVPALALGFSSVFFSRAKPSSFIYTRGWLLPRAASIVPIVVSSCVRFQRFLSLAYSALFPFPCFFYSLSRYFTQLLIPSLLFYFYAFYLFSFIFFLLLSFLSSLSILLFLTFSHHQLVIFHQCGFRL